jgi:hypothetical protein
VAYTKKGIGVSVNFYRTGYWEKNGKQKEFDIMSRGKKICVLGCVSILFVFLTGCVLFGPKLHGTSHVSRALDGASQIAETKEGKEVDEKLVELFNTEMVLAYQETEQAIGSAEADVSQYQHMSIKAYEELAELYGKISARFGGIVTTAVDYPALITGLRQKASKELLEAARMPGPDSNDLQELSKALDYVVIAKKIDSGCKDEALKIQYGLLVRKGDILLESDKYDDIELARKCYSIAMNLGVAEPDEGIADKMAYAETRLIELKIKSIGETIENGKNFKDFNEALDAFYSMGSPLQKKYRSLEEQLWERLTADILVCVGPGSDMDFRSPKQWSPVWAGNEGANRPKKIVVEYEYFNSADISVPSTHAFVLVPDKDFGKVSYDYETKEKVHTVEFSASEQILAKTAIELDPDDEESKLYLQKGTYKTVSTDAVQTINNVYHLYKIEDGTPRLLGSTSPIRKSAVFQQKIFVSGSKEVIEKKTSISFGSRDVIGDTFEPNRIESYFDDRPSLGDLYKKTVDDLKPYFGTSFED